MSRFIFSIGEIRDSKRTSFKPYFILDYARSVLLLGKVEFSYANLFEIDVGDVCYREIDKQPRCLLIRVWSGGGDRAGEQVGLREGSAPSEQSCSFGAEVRVAVTNPTRTPSIMLDKWPWVTSSSELPVDDLPERTGNRGRPMSEESQ